MVTTLPDSCVGQAPASRTTSMRRGYGATGAASTTAGLAVSPRCGSYTASSTPSESSTGHGPPVAESTPSTSTGSTFPWATSAATVASTTVAGRSRTASAGETGRAHV